MSAAATAVEEEYELGAAFRERYYESGSERVRLGNAILGHLPLRRLRSQHHFDSTESAVATGASSTRASPWLTSMS